MDASGPVVALTAGHMVSDVTSYGLVLVEPSATLREAAELMAAAETGALLVQRHQQPSAIFTERDLVQAIAEGQELDATVEGYATGELVRVEESEPVQRAWEAMASASTRHVLVDRGGRAVGMVSARDLVRYVTTGATAP